MADEESPVVQGEVVARSRMPKALSRTLRNKLQKHRFQSHPATELVHTLGGPKAVFAFLEFSSDPTALKIVHFWRKAQVRDWAEGFTVEDVLAAAEVTPKQFAMFLVGESWEWGVNLAKLIHSGAMSDMMKASIRRAKQPNATAERKMHFEASGFLPTRAGIQIGIKNIQQSTPPLEETPPGRPRPHAITARSVVRDLPPAK